MLGLLGWVWWQAAAKPETAGRKAEARSPRAEGRSGERAMGGAGTGQEGRKGEVQSPKVEGRSGEKDSGAGGVEARGRQGGVGGTDGTAGKQAGSNRLAGVMARYASLKASGLKPQTNAPGPGGSLRRRRRRARPTRSRDTPAGPGRPRGATGFGQAGHLVRLDRWPAWGADWAALRAFQQREGLPPGGEWTCPRGSACR